MSQQQTKYSAQFKLKVATSASLSESSGSGSRWYIRPNFYDNGGGSLGHANADSSKVSDLTWQYRGGRIATPANTATVRVVLLNHLNSGWVAFDDVRLTAAPTATATIPC